MPGLRLSGSFYYCANAASNADKSETYGDIGKVPVRIYNLEGQYKNKYVEARANFLWGNLGNSYAVSSKNVKQSNKSPYSRIIPVAHKAVAFGGEAGLRLKGFFLCEKMPDLIPFVRYEYYNPQQTAEGTQTVDARCQVSKWVGGINWFALPNVVVKADWTTRKIGTASVFGASRYNRENEFSIGVAYAGWFFKK